MQVNAGRSKNTNVNALIAHWEPKVRIDSIDCIEKNAAVVTVVTDTRPTVAAVSPKLDRNTTGSPTTWANPCQIAP